jgi:energy-coupling factor transporter ATP-binding protein EcfA2
LIRPFTMLKRLHIRDFVILADVSLEFDRGMTVFTGETGAGKSILIDALGLVLGDRADASVIREGSERTEITASFDLADTAGPVKLLAEQAIGMEDNELIIRRVVTRDGRSRAFVNNSQVPAQLLRDLGGMRLNWRRWARPAVNGIRPRVNLPVSLPARTAMMPPWRCCNTRSRNWRTMHWRRVNTKNWMRNTGASRMPATCWKLHRGCSPALKKMIIP